MSCPWRATRRAEERGEERRVKEREKESERTERGSNSVTLGDSNGENVSSSHGNRHTQAQWGGGGGRERGHTAADFTSSWPPHSPNLLSLEAKRPAYTALESMNNKSAVITCHSEYVERPNAENQGWHWYLPFEYFYRLGPRGNSIGTQSGWSGGAAIRHVMWHHRDGINQITGIHSDKSDRIDRINKIWLIQSVWV